MKNITVEQYLNSKEIYLDKTTLVCFIDGAMRQPDLCKLIEDYAALKITELDIKIDSGHLDLQAPKITDLSDCKVWFGYNLKLSRMIQQRAFELGWVWADGGHIILESPKFMCLQFTKDKKIFYGLGRGAYEEWTHCTGIFPEQMVDVEPENGISQS